MNLNTIIATLDYLLRKAMALIDSLMKKLGIETTVAPETTTVADAETTTVAPEV
ncbi:MAG: hypothetical protein IKW03_02565 [Clostridia bacterium]|nr:hypothetical protein [Clostridia bacterium]